MSETVRENAVYMIDILPASDVTKVISFGEELLAKGNTPFKPISEDQVRKGLELSGKQAQNGKVKDASEVLDSLSEKYGL
ncbi:MAG: hypothetical protein K6C08_01210 [Oscillospiraceae bacterium]|nr:hypothetical protein [Oscillospiraceae bacterium]